MSKAVIAAQLNKKYTAQRMAAGPSSTPSTPYAPPNQGGSLGGGFTSTMLTGYAGEDPDKLKTSRILLGSGGRGY